MDHREVAWYLLQSLKDQRLEVVVIGGLRKVVGSNPKWYQELCATYTTWRRGRHRTIIKRQHTMRTLERIARDLPAGPVYSDRLERFLDISYL